MAYDHKKGAANGATPERGGDASNGRQRGKFSAQDSRSFVILWREAVRDDQHIPSQTTLVLHSLATFMSASGYGRPGLTRLSKACKLNKWTGPDIVGRELNLATELGYLEITPREGKTNLYQAVIPTCPEQGGTSEDNPPALSVDPPALGCEPTYPEQVRSSREQLDKKQIEEDVVVIVAESFDDEGALEGKLLESDSPTTNPSSRPAFSTDLHSDNGGGAVAKKDNTFQPYRAKVVRYSGDDDFTSTSVDIYSEAQQAQLEAEGCSVYRLKALAA